MGIAFVMIGAPGARRQEYAAFIAAQIPGSWIIDADKLKAVDCQEGWDSPENFLLELKHALHKGKVPIFTTANARPGNRHHIIDRCLKAGANEIVGIWCQASLSRCRARSAASAIGVKKIFRSIVWNPPSLEEGFTTLIEIDTAEMP